MRCFIGYEFIPRIDRAFGRRSRLSRHQYFFCGFALGCLQVVILQALPEPADFIGQIRDIVEPIWAQVTTVGISITLGWYFVNRATNA